MRLINVNTLELEEFFDIDVPPYAILSHTWASDEGECTLNDWNDKRNRKFKPGFQKLARACAEAAKDNLSYLWADTCCIDKSSSSELSEAINSMFKYYKRSVICYAYLVDVEWSDIRHCKQEGSEFRESRWFTRGWTLQELIAPAAVIFYSKDWEKLGTKTELALPIAETTGIGLWCLLRGKFSKFAKQNPLSGYSIAQRLCWASRRSTTRIEDQAYCLLGLFDIHMPLVYGEGYEAFTRLLEEVVRKYPDQSFLCSQLRYVDFLPRSPKDFDSSHHVILSNSPRLRTYYSPGENSQPFHMTNLGLEIRLPLVTTFSRDFHFAVLDCWDADSEINDQYRHISRIWLPLMRRNTTGYSRMLFPRTFFPVRLISKDIILGHDILDGIRKSYRDAEEESSGRAVVDLLSPDRASPILIKKSFAATVVVKKYQFQDPAVSPFLICFPRGSANYRLYKVFPETPDTQDHLHLSLVMTRKLNVRKDEDSSEDGLEDNAQAPQVIHGAFITLKERGTRPSSFLTVFLANLQYYDKHTDELTYRPSCKIMPDWSVPDGNTPNFVLPPPFGRVDQHDNTLITVQRIPYQIGKEIQSVGLAQIIFDLDSLRREIHRSAPQENRHGIVKHYGKESSDEEDDNRSVISEMVP